MRSRRLRKAANDRDRIGANLEKGVLTITLPKSAEAQRQQKKIEVKGKN
jgi:HSP20 family molecular chaperone IbpA